MSRNCQPRSEATCATICDFPTPHAPQICKGTRSVMSAWSASKSSEGFMDCPLEGLPGLCALIPQGIAALTFFGWNSTGDFRELLSYEDREHNCESVEKVSSCFPP